MDLEKTLFGRVSMGTNKKQELITFKVDSSLSETLRGIQNRSEFIRQAILVALDNICPLCSGSGILTSNQRKHWDQFSANHDIDECDECHEIHLVCEEIHCSNIH